MNDRLHGLLFTWVLAASLTACTAGRAPEPWVPGDHSASAALNRQILENEPPNSLAIPESLLRLGALLADPESDVYDPAEARHVLTRLVNLDSQSPHAITARLMLESLDRAEEIERRDRRILALRIQLETLAEVQQRLVEELKNENEKTTDLAEQVRTLTARARYLTGELSELEDELEQLKAIDLEGAPPESDERSAGSSGSRN